MNKLFKTISASTMALFLAIPIWSQVQGANAADSNWDNQYQNYNQNYQNYDQNSAPTVYYTQRNFRNFRYQTDIYRRYGNGNPQQIGTVPGYPTGYRMSPDKSHIAFNYGNRVRFYNTKTNQIDRNCGPYRNVTGLTYSPDGNNLFIWDQGNLGSGYNAYYYNFDQNRYSNQYHGNNTSSFYPYAWRNDGNILMLNRNNGNENLWYYNGTNNTLHRTNYYNPSWMSQDGRYIAMPYNYNKSGSNYSNKASHHYYDPRGFYTTDGYSDGNYGQFRMYDPCSSSYYGTIGNPNSYNQIITYSPNRNQVLYNSYSNYQNYRNLTNPCYYTQTVGSNYNPTQTYNPNDIYRKWGTSAGIQVSIYGDIYVIFEGRNAIARSTRPMGMISQYYGDPYYNSY